MANYKKLFWTLAALPLLTACSNDDPILGNEDIVPGKDGFFMTVRLTPTGGNGTRSQTVTPGQSSDGEEVGTDVENAVNNVMIVLAEPGNNALISYGVVKPQKDSGLKDGTISSGIAAGSSVVYQATAQFSETDLQTYYDANGPKTVNVYVYCNPSNKLLVAFDNLETGSTDWVNMTADVTGNTNELWNGTNGFIMTNASPASRELPATMDDWKQYTTVSKPFDLSAINAPGTESEVDNLNKGRGTIPVHRMAARLDFKDGSQMLKDGQPVGNGVIGTPFTYGVVKNIDGDVIVNVELHAMALNNMEKTQYYLGRVSDNGREVATTTSGANNNYTICGEEKAWINGAGGNYVISPDWLAKYTDNGIVSNFSNYFEYPFFNNAGIVQDKGNGWDWIDCEKVVANSSDNFGDKSYHVWRYLTENAIPGPAAKQTNGQSTGVAFKGHLRPTEELKNSTDKWEKMLYEALAYDDSSVGANKLLHNNMDTDPTIYSLSGNSLYVTWENVYEAALSEAGFDFTKNQAYNEAHLDRLSPLFRVVFGENGGVGVVKDAEGKVIFTDPVAEIPTSCNYLWKVWQTNVSNAANKSAFKEAATGQGFTLYQSSQDPTSGKWGYYCYYYYWVRHNDNLQNGVMGPMEFAIVRNNVYKLAVTNIATLGHPRIPENDPDKPTPPTPDESAEVYVTVSVQVLPWVVRINNIPF